ncbi:hypothetical protein M413DRAFT_27292 [Hebeloma cylindrosporum]|uniref:PIH1 N-terminal domain-containing protein n=1 Tax=Hebeloma cylindrosporum TaxID=76867 RepID=A0A0C2YL06_HEBCY|nr:hypothetical protein M413DRAFT_27292 [Hebeloma cylindrosporum h7]
MSSSTRVRIELSPKAGFCIKSSTLSPAVLPPPPPPTKPNANLLEPASGPIPIAKGLKVFVNIAWDANVPPPPEGSEEAIQRAMQGEDVDEGNPSGWYVPVIVSSGRQDTDKAGNPSLVFDCIYNTTVKSRTLRDPEFKIFLVELALQRIEAQSGLALSRNIGTPNIASKGKLLPRTVQVPAAMLPALTGAPSAIQSPTQIPSKPLIQEVSAPTNGVASSSPTSIDKGANINAADLTLLPGLRGILKKPAPSASGSSTAIVTEKGATKTQIDDAPLDWSWTKDEKGRLRVEVHVPGLTRSLVQSSTLDVEPRRIILAIPGRRVFDIDLELSDAELTARIGMAHSSCSSPGSSSSSPNNSTPKGKVADEEKERRENRKEADTTRTLQLKRQRDFVVDGAEAEWEVGGGKVVIYV